MASFLGSMISKLTGGSDAGGAAKAGRSEEYRGYTITATPRQEGSQWLTSGVITKADGEDVKEHSFIRADRHASRDEAESFSLTKGRQIVDEQGDAVFRKAHG